MEISEDEEEMVTTSSTITFAQNEALKEQNGEQEVEELVGIQKSNFCNTFVQALTLPGDNPIEGFRHPQDIREFKVAGFNRNGGRVFHEDGIVFLF